MNFSSHMLRKAVCSLTDTDPVFIFLLIYHFHPPMLLVSILKDAFSSKRKGLSAAWIFRPVSITTSIRVGVIGPRLNINALMASDQKWEADISIGSFLIISDKDKFRHWLISYCSQLVLWELAILRNQFLHPGVTLGQDLKAWEQSMFISEDLRGILLVSRLMILVGSGLPMGPKQIMLGWFSSEIIILPLRLWK